MLGVEERAQRPSRRAVREMGPRDCLSVARESEPRRESSQGDGAATGGPNSPGRVGTAKVLDGGQLVAVVHPGRAMVLSSCNHRNLCSHVCEMLRLASSWSVGSSQVSYQCFLCRNHVSMSFLFSQWV